MLNSIQTDFPDQVGKTFSLRMTISRSCNALGLLLAAPLIAGQGVTVGIALASCAVGAFAALAWLRNRAAMRPVTIC